MKTVEVEDQLFHWLASITNTLKNDSADAYIKIALLLQRQEGISCSDSIPVFIDMSQSQATGPFYAKSIYHAQKETFIRILQTAYPNIKNMSFCQVDETCDECSQHQDYELGENVRLTFVSDNHYLQFIRVSRLNSLNVNSVHWYSFFEKIPLFLKWIGVSRTHIHNLIHHIEDGIILITKNREIAIMNGAAKTLLGIPHNLALGQISNFIISIFSNLLEEVDHSGNMISREFPLTQPVERVLKIDVTPLQESKEYAVLMRDISQYKEVDRMKTEIITTVSHELRTPLTAIDSLSRNLIRGIAGTLPEKALTYLSRIQNNTQRLTHLINNLLDLSKLEAGESPIKRGFSKMKPFIENIISSLEAKALEKNINLTLDYRLPDQECLLADLPKWDQVLMNLLGNAIKFSPEGGQVRLSIEKQRTHVTFAVSDNGPGIPEYEKKNIFQKFKQIGREYGAGEKGTGLGLAIVKQILTMHEARIHVESPPKYYLKDQPTGSEFIVELPCFDEKESFALILKDHVQLMHEHQGCHAVVHLKFQKKELLDVLTDPVDNILTGIRGVIKRATDDVIFFPHSRKLFLIIQTDDENVLQSVLKRIHKVVKDKTLKGRFSKNCFPYVILKPGIESLEKEQVLKKMWEDV